MSESIGRTVGRQFLRALAGLSPATTIVVVLALAALPMAVQAAVPQNGTASLIVGTPANVIPNLGQVAPPYANAEIESGVLPPGVSYSAEGRLSGTPTVAGVYSVHYSAEALDGGISGVLTISVTAAPASPPVANPAFLTTPFGTAVSGSTASLVAGAYTGIAIAGGPANGAAEANGVTFTYRPNAGFSGIDRFSYIASGPGGVSAAAVITVTVLEGPPGAAALAVQVPFNSPGVVIDLAPALSGAATGVQIVSQPGRGAAAVTGLRVTYVPTAGLSGADSFTYRAIGPGGASNLATATLLVEGPPEPGRDPEVSSVIGAQADQVSHFADLQMEHFNSHLESIGEGGGPGGGLSFTGSAWAQTPEAAAQRRRGLPATSELWFPGQPAAGAEMPDIFNAAPGGPGGAVAVWSAGGIDISRRKGAATRAPARFVTVGVSGGIDVRVSPRLVAGVGAGYNRDRAETGSRGSRSRAEGYFAVGYAAWRPQPRTFVNLVAGYGALTLDSRRHVSPLGVHARGSRDGDAWFGALTAGVTRRTGRVDWSPYLRLSGLSGSLDPFTETGGGAYNLAYSRQRISTLVATAGLRGSRNFAIEQGALTPRIRLEYLAAGHNRDRLSVTYASWTGSPVFALSERMLDRRQATAAVGARLVTRSGLVLDAEYGGALVYDETRSRQLVVSVRLPF